MCSSQCDQNLLDSYGVQNMLDSYDYGVQNVLNSYQVQNVLESYDYGILWGSERVGFI